jgi:hypothetical protein
MQKIYIATIGRDSRAVVMPFAGPTSGAVHLK